MVPRRLESCTLTTHIGRGILAIVLLLAGMWAGILGSILLPRLFDQAMGIPAMAESRGGLTPTMHILGMFANALLIPLSMLIQRWLYGVPFASFYSGAAGGADGAPRSFSASESPASHSPRSTWRQTRGYGSGTSCSRSRRA